jgi:riboflavin synthase
MPWADTWSADTSTEPAAWKAARKQGDTFALRIAAPPEVAPYLFSKGSIAVDGVSLTVNKVDGSSFEVLLIPHTLVSPCSASFVPLSHVNLEADMIAKQVARIVERIHDR